MSAEPEEHLRAAHAREHAGPRGRRHIDALLAAARAQFTQRGWRDTTVADILAAANVSRATFYRYFTGRRDILHALAQRYLDDVTPATETLYTSGLTDPARTAEAIADYIERYRRHAGIARIWAEEAPQDATLMSIARKSSITRREQFRQAFGTTSRLDADAAFLLVYALTDRFPYYAFAVGSPGATALGSPRVVDALSEVLGGIARARDALDETGD